MVRSKYPIFSLKLEREQNILPQNVPLWNKVYLELAFFFNKKHIQENLGKPSRNYPFIIDIYMSKRTLHLQGFLTLYTRKKMTKSLETLSNEEG